MSATSPWLEAWFDPLANARAFSSCVRFADIRGNGDYHLLVGTEDAKLKVFAGMGLVKEIRLPGVPSSVCAISDSVAVASGCYVFMFKNLKPLCKFTVPAIETSEEERTAWERLEASSSVTDALSRELFDSLSRARDSGVSLSSRATRFLSCDDAEAMLLFLQQRSGTTSSRDRPAVTCMEVLRLPSGDRLVIGTEAGTVLIVEPFARTITDAFDLPPNSTPAQLAPLVGTGGSGGYRILILCREGTLLTIKNGELSGKKIEVEGNPIGMACAGPKEIYVGLSNSVIEAYTMKGRKTCAVRVDADVLDVDVLKRGSARVLVTALGNGDVRLYKKRRLLDATRTSQVVMGMRCGRYGRSDVCLATVYRSGAVRMRIMRRTAKLVAENEDSPHASSSSSSSSSSSLELPKRTRLYVEQAQRERDHASTMHRAFQSDMRRLRLTSAEAYVKLLKIRKRDDTSSSSSKIQKKRKSSSVRLSAEVRGLGPEFVVVARIRTDDDAAAARNVRVVVSYDVKLYAVPAEGRSFVIPVIVPGVTYRRSIRVESIDRDGAAGVLRLSACRGGGRTLPRGYFDAPE